jgi:hypothetical protein
MLQKDRGRAREEATWLQKDNKLQSQSLQKQALQNTQRIVP